MEEVPQCCCFVIILISIAPREPSLAFEPLEPKRFTSRERIKEGIHFNSTSVLEFSMFAVNIYHELPNSLTMKKF